MNWFQKKMAGHSSSALISCILGFLSGAGAFTIFYAKGMPGEGVGAAFPVSGLVVVWLFIYHIRMQGMHERLYGCLPLDRHRP